jgi:hypothetical protein
MIGDHIRITVVAVQGDQVRLAVHVPATAAKDSAPAYFVQLLDDPANALPRL